MMSKDLRRMTNIQKQFLAALPGSLLLIKDVRWSKQRALDSLNLSQLLHEKVAAAADSISSYIRNDCSLGKNFLSLSLSHSLSLAATSFDLR